MSLDAHTAEQLLDRWLYRVDHVNRREKARFRFANGLEVSLVTTNGRLRLFVKGPVPADIPGVAVDWNSDLDGDQGCTNNEDFGSGPVTCSNEQALSRLVHWYKEASYAKHMEQSPPDKYLHSPTSDACPHSADDSASNTGVDFEGWIDTILEQGHYEAAASALHPYIINDPSNIRLLQLMVWIRSEQGFPVWAQKYANRAKELNKRRQENIPIDAGGEFDELDYHEQFSATRCGHLPTLDPYLDTPIESADNASNESSESSESNTSHLVYHPGELEGSSSVSSQFEGGMFSVTDLSSDNASESDSDFVYEDNDELNAVEPPNDLDSDVLSNLEMPEEQSSTDADPGELDFLEEQVFPAAPSTIGAVPEWLELAPEDDEEHEPLEAPRLASLMPEVETSEHVLNPLDRARLMANQLVWESAGGDQKLKETLTSVFLASPWSATKRAMQRLLDSGVGATTLETALAARRIWADHPEFAIRLSTSQISGESWQRTEQAMRQIGWPMAIRIANAWRSCPEEGEIEIFLIDLYEHWVAQRHLHATCPEFRLYVHYRIGGPAETLDILPEWTFENDQALFDPMDQFEEPEARHVLRETRVWLGIDTKGNAP